MIQVLGALLLAGALVVRFRKEPVILLLIGLGLHLFIPSVLVQGQLAVAGLSLHPGSAVMLLALLVAAWQKRRRILTFLHDWVEAMIVILGLCALGVVHILLTGRTTGVSFVADQIVVPLSAVVTVGLCLIDDPAKAEWLRRGVLGIAVFQGLFANLQRMASQTILWDAAYATQDWYTTMVPRFMGTLDHPLVLAMVLVSAVPLTVGVKRWWLRLPMIAILLSGIFITQSRLGLVVAVAAAGYVLVFGEAGGRVRVAQWIVAAAFGIAALSGGLLEGTLDRFVGADDSTQARVQATEYFLGILPDHLWLGQGILRSFDVASRGGLGSSLENSLFMMIIDFGGVTTVFYYGLLVALIVVGIARRSAPGFALAAAIAVFETFSFSALGVRASAAPWLWVLVAMVAFAAPTGSLPGPGRRPEAERRGPDVGPDRERPAVRELPPMPERSRA
ncbi:MAG: hypothetical protein Q4G51_06840 [Dermatophilus congolensis]|nr:hypothetical protein [Dermatophilus congolensis]